MADRLRLRLRWKGGERNALHFFGRLNTYMDTQMYILLVSEGQVSKQAPIQSPFIHVYRIVHL
jgi:hypothetical protein